jgi:AraC family transcriptional regulator
MHPRDLLDVLHVIGRRLDEDLSLRALSAHAGWSPFHLHRALRRFGGETAKQYTQRLRLTRAAARLATSDDTVLEIALDAGFNSHAVFTRAFRRQFGRAPAEYRTTALAGVSDSDRARHAELSCSIAPCVRLIHTPAAQPPRRHPMPVLSITREERDAQPILFMRRRIARADLQATLAECFGTLYGHAQKTGLALAGFPLARYLSTGPGLWNIEPAIPLVAPAPGEGDMQAGFLPGGPLAVGIHAGAYDHLADTHSAIERWIEANNFRVGGAPWEWYVTDPGEHPDPADWRTEVYWPLAE